MFLCFAPGEAELASKLILNPGKSDEQVFELSAGPNSIGRTQQNAVFVLHKSLSRQHAVLFVRDDGFSIEDLRSKNGTFVDGVRVTKRELGQAHAIKCGDVQFSFVHGDGVEAVTEPRPDVGSPTLVCDPGKSQSLDDLLALAPGGMGTALNLKSPLLGADRGHDKLQILLKVSETLSSPATLEDTLGRILELAFRILDIDRATVVLRRDGRLTTAASRTRSGAGEDSAYSQSVVGWVLDRGVSALFGDTRADPRLAGAASILHQSIHASMCAPLKARDRLLGALYVDNLTRPDRFVEEDLEFLTAFANQAAIAIDNAGLRDELAEQAVARNTLMRFFPPTSVDAIMTSGTSLDAIETEATILFCDISGFTRLSSTLQPRQIIDLLNTYFPVMSDIVFRHEGTLEKYIGDALLAVWGAPIKRPDDAKRAVAAAVDMQGAMAGLNAQLSLAAPLRIHIGVNSGRVAAGNIGSRQFLQYATIGDATNVAARVCNEARAGEILIDALTAERVAASGGSPWPVEPLPPVTVKGKATPLSLLRVRFD
jgi:adenylate cyclase